MTNLSLIIPAHNEQAAIGQTVDRTFSWLAGSGMSGEVIVVDDGSTDGTYDVLQKLSQEHTNLQIIRHEKNCGFGVAVRTGIDAAKGDLVGFMDGDGQFNPEDFQLLLNYIDDYSFVAGYKIKRADPFMRDILGKALTILNIFIFGLFVRDVNCGLKLFRKSIWPKIRPMYGTEKYFHTELFLRLRRNKIPWKQVGVHHYPRLLGKSHGASPKVIFKMFTELFNLRLRG